MNNLENTTQNETILKTDENKYNLKKIDTEIIKNQVLMKNTFYAFKKAGNCRICINILKTIGIFLLSIFLFSLILGSFLPNIVVNILDWIFIAIFIFAVISIRNKNQREAYQRFLEQQMIGIYSNDLATLNFIPENVNYKVIQMIEVSGENYNMAKYNLIKSAFYLGADGIINITHSSTATSSITGGSISNTKINIETETKTNVYMQGIAIKLV
ncbi:MULTISPECIES: hypothetical protein [Aliarcobacter]|uniref:Uncharacterized protein n=1 Tax=Aliarcobacter butzleri L352 TaxID=1447260 RepID=A0A837JCJ1_9BACT|nr:MULTISPECIES: hypothetical protein [Aliarcobacter]KLE06053.1 hypothetical protein AF77_03025 [Aliarcobacter butzleri L352]MBL3518908.1 hypothetical protein [Aliarcobacter lanthieri]